jgi:hypothetical protein
MRTKAIIMSASLLCIALSLPQQAEARARGGGPGGPSGSSVGFSGGAVIGAHASPYYYGPYGYSPAYYHSTASYSYSGYVYGYGENAPYYRIATNPYAAGTCWHRRQAIYGTYGEVAGIRAEHACQ